MVKLNFLRLPLEISTGGCWGVSTLAPLFNLDGTPMIDPKTGLQKVDKSPRHPLTGYNLSMDHPEQWASFDDAVNAGYPAIGRLIRFNEGLVVIDLDHVNPNDPQYEQASHVQTQIREVFGNTYAETSQSGMGQHIFVQAHLNGGRRTKGVEVYGNGRYMLVTGDAVSQQPVLPMQAEIDELIASFSREDDHGDDLPPEERDHRWKTATELLIAMRNAKNGPAFSLLMDGPLLPGADHSLLDFQLAQQILFRTRDKELYLDVFRQSVLYRGNGEKYGYASREKYEQDYLIGKTWTRAYQFWRENDAQRRKEASDMQARVERDVLNKLNTKQERIKEKVKEERQEYDERRAQHEADRAELEAYETIPWPPGLMGEVAQYIYDTAPRPVQDIAIAGAISFMSGIVGRQFNISGMGMNLYTLIVAGTGRGKEGATSGLNRLYHAIGQREPSMDIFRGPGHIASGQGLVAFLLGKQYPCCLSILNEFGHTLENLTRARPSASDVTTRRVLLDLFSKSGKYDHIAASAYADKEKNGEGLNAPAFAIMGDTTLDKFFEHVDSGLLSEGFLPRLLTIIYHGQRVDDNKTKNRHPSDQLVDKLCHLVSTVNQMAMNNVFRDLPIQYDAQEILDTYDQKITLRINKAKDAEVELVELYSRAHQKVLRLAGVLAASRNVDNPVVTTTDVYWAMNVVDKDIKYLLDRFRQGKIGGGESTHHGLVVEAIKQWLHMDTVSRLAYSYIPRTANGALIPHQYLYQRLGRIKTFKDHPLGATRAIKMATQEMLDAEILLLEPNPPSGSKRSVVYLPGPAFPFD